MENASLFIKQNDRHIRVGIGEILYLQARGSYLTLVTTSDKYSIAQNLSQFLRRNHLPAMRRIHRSFIVNVNCIESFDRKFVYIDQKQIPIGDAYRQEFMKVFSA